MPGINKAKNPTYLRASEQYTPAATKKCVFISHQKADTIAAKQVADYIMSAGLDVYFDEYDNDLRIKREEDNPKGVTDCILKGINKSDFMLCVVSQNTMSSTWVPFEVGYGYDKTDLGILTLKGLHKRELPQYAHAAKFIVDSVEVLNSVIAKEMGTTKFVFESTNRTFSTTMGSAHRLSNVMNLV